LARQAVRIAKKETEQKETKSVRDRRFIQAKSPDTGEKFFGQRPGRGIEGDRLEEKSVLILKMFNVTERWSTGKGGTQKKKKSLHRREPYLLEREGDGTIRGVIRVTYFPNAPLGGGKVFKVF